MARQISEVGWEQSAQELYTLYRKEPHVERRKRLHVLWLVRRRAAGYEPPVLYTPEELSDG
jgi:hypothetical protein